MEKIIIQLLTHGGMDTRTLVPLFDSLRAQTDRNFEVLWWDNGATEDHRVRQRAALAEHGNGLQVTRFEHPTNIGFAGGHQALYEKHRAEYVLLLNDDAFFAPDYVEKLRAVLDADRDLGAVSGLVLRWDFDDLGVICATNVIDTAGTLRTRWHAVSDAGAGESRTVFAIPSNPFGVSGCVPMYRRSAIGAQLFDPTYFFYKEDIDLAYRLKRTGYRVLVVPEAIAYHRRTFRPGTRREVPLRAKVYSYRNHLRNLARHVTWRDWITDGWAILPYECAKFAYLLVMNPKVLYYAWKPDLCPTT